MNVSFPGPDFWKSSLPILLQVEAAECGLVCLAMVASFHGHKVELSALSRKFPAGLRGMTLASLIDVAEQLELSARPLRIELSELRDLSVPCILHWDLNHFVVLKKVVAAGNSIVIHDPARGKVAMAMTEASRHFTGVALELCPTSSFKRRDERQKIGLRDVVGKTVGLWKSATQIFALAVCLEMLAVIAPLFMQIVVDNAVITGDNEFLIMLSLGFGILLLIQVTIGLFRSWMVLYLSARLNVQWLSNTFAHLVKLPISFFEKRHLGDIVSKFRAVNNIQAIISSSFIEVLVDGLMSLAMLIMMFFYSTLLATIVVGSMSFYLVLRIALVRTFRIATEEQVFFDAKEQSLFLETIRSIQAIRLFGQEVSRRIRWENATVDVTNRNTQVQKIEMGFVAARTLLLGVENILVISVGAFLVNENLFSIGMLFAFISYKATFSSRISSLIEKIFQFSTIRVQCDRLADILLTSQEKAESESSVPVDVALLDMCLEMREVSFRYSVNDELVLNNISFKVRSGESVAIVGPSGCGKTTLVKLILGLLKPESGTILLGGVSINAIGNRVYREQLGVVMQEDYLLAGSLAENISFFATSPENIRIVECAKLAGIHEEITKMPLGYETRVGDMGIAISGGQKQRILLARALYKKPRLLVLDEATSHLDADKESIVNAAIRNLNLTKIIVAHRKETIKSADRIVELCAGTVVRNS